MVWFKASLLFDLMEVQQADVLRDVCHFKYTLHSRGGYFDVIPAGYEEKKNKLEVKKLPQNKSY